MLFLVLGVLIRTPSPFQLTDLVTLIQPPSKSTSRHWRAITSPSRQPVNMNSQAHSPKPSGWSFTSWICSGVGRLPLCFGRPLGAFTTLL